MSAAAIPPNVNRSPGLITSLWVPWPFATLLLIARFWSRIARRDLGLDDWFMLVCWVLYTTAISLSTLMVSHGSIRHIEYLSSSELTYVLKLQTINEPIGMFALIFGKSSVALFIKRIFSGTKKWRRWFLDINVVLYFLVSLAVLGIMFGQCTSPAALWEPELEISGKVKCINSTFVLAMYMLQGAWGAYLDFALAFLPLTFLLELKINMQKRIALCILLGLGVIAGVCASIKTWAFTKAESTTDVTWNGYALYLWTALELAFLVIAGCIPPSKTIWDYFREGKPIRLTQASASYKLSNQSYDDKASRGVGSHVASVERRGDLDDEELLCLYSV
ncbi:hypothetical protein BO70DRAFT_350749 [Aspergillus heteromorphus CBS 117.55]|uniref:Rhodopsin domain-containing protein n=1 Tax=Aspergillus heteromorphus CBS 117.55 TaxID=1448321 RepID=A0A317WPN9_9EURO|nr:uncharacterized protein BO70DRAFT_350749 [Aspergillus heteromorphus CBS 117.55]PWY88383.1 hypothetical protein BO70DRAFT_350749 [Aspergillus heteromorphus CBS 117.55]